VQGKWQLAILGGAIAVAALVVSGFLVFEHGDKSSAKPPREPKSGISYGNAKISARTIGGPYRRTVVVKVKDRRTGVPLHRAKVMIHGRMTDPHLMTLYEKRLREASRGEYRGPYTLIMQGDWRIVIVVTSKQGDTSTSSLAVPISG